MEPWRAEGQWETVKPLKGGKAVAKDDSQGQAKKGKKGLLSFGRGRVRYPRPYGPEP